MVGVVLQVKQPSVCGGGNVSGTVSAATENWDGTAWSTSPATLAAARQGSANGIGTSSSNGIQAGGYTTSYVSTVEEYNFTANTVTAAAWSSGGAITTAILFRRCRFKKRWSIYGGWDGPPNVKDTLNHMMELLGREVNNLNTARSILEMETGTQTAAIILVERIQVLLLINKCYAEEYDGTSWTSLQSSMDKVLV